jgi:signal transduction histidine kinase
MQNGGNEHRVLVLAPTGCDAAALCRALSAASIEGVECSTPDDFCERIGEGAGAALIAEEVLSFQARRAVARVLAAQPPWDELPLIVLGLQDSQVGPGQLLLEELKGTASAIFLQRPIYTAALLSVVRAALQSRARQYQIRDELIRRGEAEHALRESERRLRELNETLERRVAERTEALENRATQLRRLAHELTRAEHRERKKLARTLHDGLQQILIAIKMQLSSQPGENRHAVSDRVDSLLDETIRISKSLAFELSPPILHEGELAEALDWLARWFSENYGFTVRLELAADFPLVPEDTKLFLFQAIRELLLNAVKHSGGRTATVRSRADGSRGIQIEVRDEGAGFDPATVAKGHAKGFGLFSVQERLSALDGDFEIDSSPGAGARFVLNVPLPERETRHQRSRAV